MGEMADMANEGWADYGHLWYPPSRRNRPSLVDCKFCGLRCYWKQTPDGWRTWHDGAIHTCK